MNNILKINHLTKIFTDTNRGVNDINMSVKSGSFHAFIGENGAGKTTTIKTIIGAFSKYEGEVLINNINIKKAQAKSYIGYVPEVAIFPKELTTIQYLTYLGFLSMLDKKEVEHKIKEFLEMFNISNLINEKPYNFSSGQKKKILLIQALLHNPKLLILDEPAANLDPTARYELFSFLKKINEKENISILISSHNLSEIDKYVDSLTLIHKGKILYSGVKTKNLEDIFYEKVIAN
ncbi:ABC transporter ATP-binding protein [Mycoplasma capricolum subsp. capripneumoniae]|uniref:ABC transporter ATP-binding protein n=1 Tax=Mycoplasma capricolum TaxID=2095 RepID=UPI0004D8D41F|nr:ABC transporter ATP-binding protein [Mycoplasma capricolum]KEY84769.1 ABC transporter, ATP-binding protein [Mycoplasma capricolum subsp. capripneumoniae 99108]QDL19880.1 ABC transporter ATP-binding protein [Mycoplasma capricolum subsp. capripneumoniae]QDL20565.1 ABC transporter ATP-binding protein [Mycoplasma capricolum subsp. capripneumoniae]QDL21253.1 ABC transporter ATP-binding protein [Mycoplasma capricolum subsp. capripneumoniae]QIF40520.1 ABC transporter ATP-binding protein [Mycoplasm